MYRSDYLQRMIEEFGNSLSYALGLKKVNLTEKALKSLREAYKVYFNLDAEILDQLAPEDLPVLLTGRYALKTEQMELLARGLMTEGELLAETDPGEARDRRMKALVLFYEAEKKDGATFSLPRKNAIHDLEEMLGK